MPPNHYGPYHKHDIGVRSDSTAKCEVPLERRNPFDLMLLFFTRGIGREKFNRLRSGGKLKLCLFTNIRVHTETNVRRTNYKDVLVYVHKYAGKDRGNYWNSNLNYAQRKCGPFFFRIIKYPSGRLIPVRNEPLVHWKLTLEYTRAYIYIYIYSERMVEANGRAATRTYFKQENHLLF